ncbi:MAG: S9 family peptidase [Rhodocyclaceae bacterium]|nr:MAG: S9 family peptidase [Rhodocyclaceae bacterium]
MDAKATASFGTWTSPISARAIAAGSKTLSSIRIHDEVVFWLEGIAAQGGRVALVRADRHNPCRTITDPTLNVRTRVHEYGGGAYLVSGDEIFYSNFADNLVYAQRVGEPPRPVTDQGLLRHADFEIDAARSRLLAVQEDHTVSGREATNRLVSLSMTEPGTTTILAEGCDFYAAPRLSPDGQHLAWLSWNHPLMPWNGSELWVAAVDPDGAVSSARRVAGGSEESMCQPTWSPGGDLYVVSDRSGWWNIYRVRDGALKPICPMNAEFGRPHWIFAERMFGFCDEYHIVATFIVNGISKLARIDVRDGTLMPIAADCTEIHDIAVGKNFVVALAASPTTPLQVLRIDLATGQSTPLAQCTDAVPEHGYLSAPQGITYATAAGRIAHAFFYPPANADFLAPAGELPPLIVTSHGGPTSMAGNGLRLGIQYWTSRGFAVLDVNYGGSSGYGRAYMELLDGKWGILDVGDCVAGAGYLADHGLVDRDRMAIRGGSASGFTTLCALTFHKVFKAGASHYGVSDLAALDVDTHKFESRYSSQLVAGPLERDQVYQQRSPLMHAHLITCPMIFFQGLEDKVVPPSQSEIMVGALRKRNVPVAYVAFEGEGHGFRRAENIQRALEAELYFYGRVFGFKQADDIEPVDIPGL